MQSSVRKKTNWWCAAYITAASCVQTSVCRRYVDYKHFFSVGPIGL